MKKVINISLITLALIMLGAGCAQGSIGISHVQKKDVIVNDYYVMAEGAIFRGSDALGGIDVVRVDCYLENGTCVQSGFGLTERGSGILYDLKTYDIIESSASRVIGKYKGLAATHHIEINLVTKEVTFTETDNDSSDAKTFKLEDGDSALEKMKY